MDYSQQGAYFVTICAQFRQCLFGEIVGARHAVPVPEDMHAVPDDGTGGRAKLSLMGKIAHELWNEIPKHFENVKLDAFVVMPNHIHGIIVIWDDDHGTGTAGAGMAGAGTACRAPTAKSVFGKCIPRSLSAIIGSYKSVVTKHVRKLIDDPHFIVWQRNYHEHIIRNEKDYERICEYIINNPLQWAFDRENPNKLCEK